MKFLVSIPKEQDTDGKWTTRREPVVPCFPSQHNGAFLAVPSFMLAEKAEVSETDADPDDMVASLVAEYPGLPAKLHENYVMLVFKAVYGVEDGTVFRVLVNQKQAVLVNDKTKESKILWDEQPMK